MSDLVAKTADALALTSRNFYENSAFKLFLSFVWSAIGLFFLGLCAANGGLSQYATNMNNQNGLSDDQSNKFKDQEVGYGFAAFFFFCAFAIMIGAAFHISPVVNGSTKESTTLRRPVDLER